MREAHEVADVRSAEQSLMALVPDGALMQRAAAGLAAVCAGLLGRVYGARVVVLAGTGDNGGDALFAGARLARRGAQVAAVQTGATLHAAGADAFRAAGGEIHGPGEAGADDAGAGGSAAAGPGSSGAGGHGAAAAIATADLIIDGILGIGGHGGLREPAATLAALTGQAAADGALVVAADLPSGVDADTGVVSGPAIRADVTVTFGTIKPGLLIDPGASYAGTVQLVDIGLGPHLTARPAARALQSADVAVLLPEPGTESDKYRRGVLGVLAGSRRYTGAAVLSVGGAIRGGAGMVRLVSAGPAADLVRAHWPEAVITVLGPDDPAVASGAAAIEAAGRVQAWVAGPGLGTGDDVAELLGEVLGTDLPVLVDADGLTVLTRRKDLLSGRDPARTLITPHAGELARLTGGDHDEIEAHRLESARRAADDLGVTVLLKGSTTVVAAPGGGSAYVNSTGTPWLATAGSGDVLSGLAGALLAQGVGPAAAAGAVAAFLHGLAGRLAARDAPIGASDVLGAIPDAIRVARLGDA
ncbi:MAG: NAD(P)H-hydrate dehydratase [Streptosporangiaceae bacterium]